MVTFEQIKAIMPLAASGRINLLLPFLNETMDRFGINSKLRIASFLAQLAHESGQFLYLKELASGKDYEGRKDLGNIHLGDGVKYKGRGLIQITGYNNYLQIGNELQCDFINHPELLESPRWACISAGWFWNKNKLNHYADLGQNEKVSLAINLGNPESTHIPNGNIERNAFYKKGLEVIK